ncbi:MAG: alpha/beta hydrolase [Caldilineaceae bacterium]|nr:alpha/beta hydrolase [Caldilineaceae bacterium]MBP8105991.1 alpha/beta hydrolase [Caldilineaceae bacterium]MBP8123677.1 alpha/beta hydrolase [Caldilineaceae bacterium]MBP9071911.1 alpha/beta hydrolase [Caldilineaceae bacterium]
MKYLRWTGLALLAAAIAFIAVNWGEITFAWDLYKVKRVSDAFYADYPLLVKDIAFTDKSDVRLDLYRPDDQGGHPVFLFVHGGGWDKYDKLLHAPVAQKLMPEGMVVLIMDYTLYPNATYRQQTAEVADAIAWTIENVAQYGGDPARITVGGHSAGGHLAMLAAYDPQWLAATGHKLDEICGLIGIAGVYDADAQMVFERSTGGTAPIMTAVMEGEPNFATASPITYVAQHGADSPPVRLIHGSADDTVPLSESDEFLAALKAAGISSELLVYEGAGHTGLLLDAMVENPSRLVQDLSGFVNGCGQ